MEFPSALRYALEQRLSELQTSALTAQAQALSERYRTQTGTGRRLLTEDIQAAAYAAERMPATFGAICQALEYSLQNTHLQVTSLLDAGAGTGAASFAATEFFDPDQIFCLEREGAMRKLGQFLMQQAGSHALKNALWKSCDLARDPIPFRADLVIASYVLGEMNEKDRILAAKKLWDSTEKMLLLVEPGTPVGFSQWEEIRSVLLSQGAHLAAPCPLEEECPISSEDWCHFTCRVARSRLHRQLKGAEAPYEDEKFCYLAFVKEETSLAPARIRRHPKIEPGKITLELCSKQGLKQISIRKRDGALFKKARKANCGDPWEMDL